MQVVSWDRVLESSELSKFSLCSSLTRRFESLVTGSMSVHEPFFRCITILHLHDFVMTVLMYLLSEPYDTCGTPGISCRAVADVRLEASVLWAYALTVNGVTPGSSAVVLCDRSSHSLVTESSLVLTFDRLNPGGESTAFRLCCLSLAIWFVPS